MSSGVAMLVGAFVAGCLLGGLFFGGLLWTVRLLPAARRPGLLLALSALLRTLLAVGGIWLVMDGQWERAVAALAGFVVVRTLILRSTLFGGRPSAPSAAHTRRP